MKRLSDLYENKGKINLKQDCFLIKPSDALSMPLGKKKKVNILALGDVGGLLLIGLRLLGGRKISSIGICDLQEDMAKRYEMEANQIQFPFDYERLPAVEKIEKEDLFDCDVVVFCATKGVPSIHEVGTDVRMAQLDANSQLIGQSAKEGVEQKFDGILAVVSDPVDPLCKAALLQGLRADQVQGFGLGVMNSRAIYYGSQHERFSRYVHEGRVFGPHGMDLVVADSLDAYDHNLSLELTDMVVNANIQMRELGFKPYMAPALSSGALSILAMMEGHWNYSSVYFGQGREGAFLGAKNRRTPYGIEIENLPLQEELYGRIERAYLGLRELI